jgi:hypothetical protein
VARTHGSQGTEESCRLNKAIIAYWYRMSMITCKWFGYCGMVGACLNWHRGNGGQVLIEAIDFKSPTRKPGVIGHPNSS